MQQTSPLYQALLQDPATRKEIRVTIDGQNYGESSIVSLSTSANLFPEDTMSVGGAIAKEIVTAHKGTISASSGPEGTVFTIELPESPAAPPQEEGPARAGAAVSK